MTCMGCGVMPSDIQEDGLVVIRGAGCEEIRSQDGLLGRGRGSVVMASSNSPFALWC